MPLIVRSSLLPGPRSDTGIRPNKHAQKPVLKLSLPRRAEKCTQTEDCLCGGQRSSARKHRLCAAKNNRPNQEAGPDISQLSPALQRQWDHSKNAHLGNISVTRSSDKKVSWVCDQCPDGHPHEWVTTVNNRANGTGCPYCANKAVCQHNSLYTGAPAVAAQFSNKNQGTAHDYTSKSTKKVMWHCEHGHEWLASIFSRTSNNTGCPVCFNITKSQPRTWHPVLTDSQSPMMDKWDWELNSKAGLDPSKFTCRSHKRANWICNSCPEGQPHRWEARIGSIYNGSGCPCCSGHKACICNSLEALFPEVAAEWDYTRNDSTPADYAAKSNVKVWWYNHRRGSFLAVIKSRTYVRKQDRDSSESG